MQFSWVVLAASSMRWQSRYQQGLQSLKASLGFPRWLMLMAGKLVRLLEGGLSSLLHRPLHRLIEHPHDMLLLFPRESTDRSHIFHHLASKITHHYFYNILLVTQICLISCGCMNTRKQGLLRDIHLLFYSKASLNWFTVNYSQSEFGRKKYSEKSGFLLPPAGADPACNL